MPNRGNNKKNEKKKCLLVFFLYFSDFPRDLRGLTSSSLTLCTMDSPLGLLLHGSLHTKSKNDFTLINLHVHVEPYQKCLSPATKAFVNFIWGWAASYILTGAINSEVLLWYKYQTNSKLQIADWIYFHATSHLFVGFTPGKYSAVLACCPCC